jgi:hypothetical protein
MATFTTRTGTYPATEFGSLRAARDDWDVKARARGHAPKWRRIARNAFAGQCRSCGAEMTCGAAWTSTPSPLDLRTGACPGKART